MVFCDQDTLLSKGHIVNGVLITEPVSFPTSLAAQVVGALIRGATIVSQYDELRDGQGKLIALTPKAGVADIAVTPRATLIRNLTPQQLATLKTQFAAAVAGAKL